MKMSRSNTRLAVVAILVVAGIAIAIAIVGRGSPAVDGPTSTPPAAGGSQSPVDAVPGGVRESAVPEVHRVQLLPPWLTLMPQGVDGKAITGCSLICGAFSQRPGDARDVVAESDLSGLVSLEKRPEGLGDYVLYCEGYETRVVTPLVREGGSHVCKMRRMASLSLAATTLGGLAVPDAELALSVRRWPGRRTTRSSSEPQSLLPSRDGLLRPISRESGTARFIAPEGQYYVVSMTDELVVLSADPVSILDGKENTAVVTVGRPLAAVVGFRGDRANEFAFEDDGWTMVNAMCEAWRSRLQSENPNCSVLICCAADLRLNGERNCELKWWSGARVSVGVRFSAPDPAVQIVETPTPSVDCGRLLVEVKDSSGRQLAVSCVLFPSSAGRSQDEMMLDAGISVSIPVGGYSLEALHPPALFARRQVAVKASSQTVVEVVLDYSGEDCWLEVVGSDGAAPEYVVIRIETSRGKSAVRSIRPGAVPLFLPHGRCVLDAIVPGGVEQRLTVDVVPGMSSPLRIVLPPD